MGFFDSLSRPSRGGATAAPARVGTGFPSVAFSPRLLYRQLTEKYEGAAPTGENPKRPHGLSADLLQQPGEPTRQPSPTYDAFGNLTYDSYHHYTWDSDTSSVTVDSIGLTFDARVVGYPVVPLGVAHAIGPIPIMRAAAELARDWGVPTLASLNPIMVDGNGVCGGCRASVGDKVRFACVDGPEFHAHKVDFEELTRRTRAYLEQERLTRERHECRIGLGK